MLHSSNVILANLPNICTVHNVRIPFNAWSQHTFVAPWETGVPFYKKDSWMQNSWIIKFHSYTLYIVCCNIYQVFQRSWRKKYEACIYCLNTNTSSEIIPWIQAGSVCTEGDGFAWRSDVGSSSCILCHSVKQEIMSALSGLIRLSWGQRLRPSVKVGQHGISALPWHSLNSAAVRTWRSFRHRLW